MNSDAFLDQEIIFEEGCRESGCHLIDLQMKVKYISDIALEFGIYNDFS